jgi:serine/threonine protein kinase
MTLCINPYCPNPQNADTVQFCQSCGSELLLKLRYRAMRELEDGGFGKTYEVSDQGTPKVLKVLINNSPKAVELFQREAEVLSQLHSLGIPKVEPNSYFVFHPGDGQEPLHCLVMEKIEGMNLREYLKQRGRPIDSETGKRWLIELLTILQQVHDAGILHRDIKPQNIIFKPDGKLALIDFGAVREATGTEIATSARSGGTEVATQAGGTSIVSAGYTAPEQVNGQAMKQSDFYSLGRTFIFLLTGKEPSSLAYDAYNDALKWREYASDVESKLAELLDRMTAISVRQRPANTQEALQSLHNKPPSASPAAPKTQPILPPPSHINQPHETRSPIADSPKTNKRNALGPLLAGLIGVVALGGFFVFAQNSRYQNSVSTDTNGASTTPTTSEYPKPTCGSGGTSHQVYVDAPAQKDYIRNNFCGDAWVKNYEGRQVVQVAQFGSETDAQNFTNFLQQQNVGSVFYAARSLNSNQSAEQPAPNTDESNPTTVEENVTSVEIWLCYDEATANFTGESREDLTGQSAEYNGSTVTLQCYPK